MAYNPLFRGANANASSRQTITHYTNGTGSILAQGTPVATDSSGNLIAITPDNHASVLTMVGLCAADIGIGASGPVVDNGRLEEITISYAVGSSLYLSKAGFLQNTPPVSGVNGFVDGDYVVFIGVVIKNEFNPANKDLKIIIERVGLL